jgi:tetratricopeptide (TPR) repeat protein
VDCNKAIELNFRNEAVYILKSSAEMEIKRFKEAIADLDEAKRINPKNDYIYSQRGLVWVELNETDSAIIDFTRAIDLDSVNTFAIFNRALSWLKVPDEVAALKDLNTVIRISPYNSYAYYNRAIVLIRLKEIRGAIHDFEVVSKLDPKNIVSYFYRSKLKTELKDYQGALADLDKTIELLPEYTDAWYDRYELKIKMNDRKGAMADYNQAMELTQRNHLDPDSLKAERKDYLKNLTKLSGDFEQMNALSSKLQNQAIDITLKPMFNMLIWKADFGKVKLYDVYRKTHYPVNILTLTNQQHVIADSILLQEIDDQTRLIESLSNPNDALYKRAVTLIQLRSFDMALRDLNALLAVDSGNVTAWFSRAGTRYELIQQLTIQEDLQREITIGKMLPKTQNPQAPLTVEHTYELVVADYDRALALDPEFAFAWYNRGFVSSRMGNYREALDDFSKAVALRDDLAEAWYNRGLVSILLSENHNGCRDLSRAGELGVTDAYRVMKRYCYK